jgi:hypothetical protein
MAELHDSRPLGMNVDDVQRYVDNFDAMASDLRA